MSSHTGKNDEFYKGEGIYRIAASRESMEGPLTYGYVCGILFDIPPTRRTTGPPLPVPAESISSALSYSRPSTREVGVQIDARPLLCYQDREVPVPVPDPSGWNYPLYVSPSGDSFHTFESCWGLRNTRPRAVRFCQCCREQPWSIP